MIRQNVLDTVRHNTRCKAELQIALDRGASTIQSYLDTNNIMLTTAAALTVIRKYTNLTDSKILTSTRKVA